MGSWTHMGPLYGGAVTLLFLGVDDATGTLWDMQLTGHECLELFSPVAELF